MRKQMEGHHTQSSLTYRQILEEGKAFELAGNRWVREAQHIVSKLLAN